MKALKNLLHSRSFRSGGYSVLICGLTLAIVIALNFLAQALPRSLTRRDVTESKLYSLSQQSRELLQGLSQDVTVYWIVQSGQEDAGLQQLLKSYQAESAHFVLPPGPGPVPHVFG